jgi:hypothetical protein
MDARNIVETVQEKLRQVMAGAASEGQEYGYGFLLHRREDFGQLQFGLITLGGESMPLTHRLLNALQGVACWVYGEVPAGIETADRDRHAVHVDDEGHPTDAMARTLMVTLLTPDGSHPDDLAVCPAQGTMTPVTLTEPLLLLTATRPVGWPL